MKLAVLADTHNQADRTRLALRQLTALGAEALVHCGDLVGPEVATICCALPAYLVLGNNDLFARTAIEAAIQSAGGTCLGLGGIVDIGGKKIAVTHGHVPSERRRLLALRPDFLFVGHSHLKGVETVEGVKVVNPGALHRATPWTCALVDLENGKVRFLEIGS